jgi:hypothetical protein
LVGTLSGDSRTWKVAYLVGDVRAVSENMIAAKEKNSSFPANLHARGELSAYDRKIPFPGRLKVVNSYRTTGKSQFQEATVVTFTLIFHMF